MPYISTESVREIRNELKRTFPQFRFSVSRQNYSSVRVVIKSGPIDFGSTHKSINHYWLADHYGDRPKVLKFLQQLVGIVGRDQRELVYDGDYGSVPTYYFDINVGDWDRPYIQK